jgi:ABC-2 type transport system ATP-binding protein
VDVLTVQGLTKRFGRAGSRVTAVDGVSFTVGAGEVVGLLGPNGAGKTTTLHMVLGLVTPDAGQVRLFGRELGSAGGRERSEILARINFAAGSVSLPWALTVQENLMVFAELYALRRPRRRVVETMELLDLVRLRKRKFGKLSSGQQTRVQLAKALLNDPELLVLDEPTGSLDPDVGDWVRSLLMRLAAETGRAMLITSHNMPEVERMCDRIVFIQGGRVVSSGSAEQLTATYGADDLEGVFLRVAREDTNEESREEVLR